MLTLTDKTTTHSHLNLDLMTARSSQVLANVNIAAIITFEHLNCMIPDGVSLDGTILNITHTFETELVVVFDVLATLGIVFAIGCLIFNCGFRNRK